MKSIRPAPVTVSVVPSSVSGWRALRPKLHFSLAIAAGANAVTKVGPMEGAATREELDALLGQSEG